MNIANAVVLVTGANRGIGAVFTRELLARGARKVYAGARDPARVPPGPGVEAIRLDVTRPEDVAAAADLAGDATLVINNAGVAALGGFLGDDSEALARRLLETNYFGVLRVCRAFAPVLAGNGGGAFLNVLSIASWINSGQLAAYAASKAAAWSLTNALRHELAPQGTRVTALHMGFVDTDMTQGFQVDKSSPEEIVRQALDGLAAGLDEVLADARTRDVHRGLGADLPSYLPRR